MRNLYAIMTLFVLFSMASSAWAQEDNEIERVTVEQPVVVEEPEPVQVEVEEPEVAVEDGEEVVVETEPVVMVEDEEEPVEVTNITVEDEEDQGMPGFELVFAVAGVLAAAGLLRRRS